MTSNGEVRRQDERAPLKLRVEYKKLNTFFADYTKNISKGGTFVQTARPLEVGTEFVFVLSVQSKVREATLELAGVVKWVVRESEASSEKPAGMGISFLFASDEERKRIEKTVTGWMEESLGMLLTKKLLESPSGR